MPSKRAPEARQVRKMSRQVMVALPAWVRRRLGVEPGAEVYWHRHRAGEVVLAAKVDRRAGNPGRHDLEEELTRVTAERDQYKRYALGLDLGERRAVFAQGYEASLKQEIPLRARLDRLAGDVAEILAHVRPVRRAHRRRVETVPAPVLEAGRVPEENQEAPGGLVASAEDARDIIQGSDSPPRAEQ